MGFQKGQKIRAIRATESAYGNRFTVGTVLVVTNPDMYGRPSSHPHHRLGVNSPAAAAAAPDSAEWVVNPADFELVVLDPLKVKVGDTVTMTRGKAIVTDEVTGIRNHTHSSPRWVSFNLSGDASGESPRAVALEDNGLDAWTLTAHQPAPEPEPRNGSLALIENTAGPTVMHRINGHWVNQDTGLTAQHLPANVHPLVVVDPTEARASIAEALAELPGLTTWTQGGGLTTRSCRLVADAVYRALGIEATS